MTWNPQDMLMGLSVAVAIMLIIALYHVLFIVVDARKVARRFERITREIEAVILKPLNMTDQALNFIQSFFEEKAQQKSKHKER